MIEHAIYVEAGAHDALLVEVINVVFVSTSEEGNKVIFNPFW